MCTKRANETVDSINCIEPNPGTVMRGRAAIVCFAIGLLVARHVPEVRADVDRIAELGKLLASSSSEKARISAATALARLGDKRALKPLVAALHDPNPEVRAVAAAGLGKLGHKAALPALRSLAQDDPDDTVRSVAHQAASRIAKSNQLPDEQVGGEAVAEGATSSGGRPGFGHQGHAVDAHPDLYVVINSSADDSPGKADKPTRKVHGDIVRQVLLDQCRTAPQVTTVATDAQRWGLDARHVDLSVTKLELGHSGSNIEIEAELRLAISDDTGRMLSILSGGAKVTVPSGKFDTRYLPALRREALENAMRGMFEKLITHLRDRSSS
jgi:hypothetical protein